MRRSQRPPRDPQSFDALADEKERDRARLLMIAETGNMRSVSRGKPGTEHLWQAIDNATDAERKAWRVWFAFGGGK